MVNQRAEALAFFELAFGFPIGTALGGFVNIVLLGFLNAMLEFGEALLHGGDLGVETGQKAADSLLNLGVQVFNGAADFEDFAVLGAVVLLEGDKFLLGENFILEQGDEELVLDAGGGNGLGGVVDG